MREIKFRGYAVEEMIGSQWLTGFGVFKIKCVDDTNEYILFTGNGNYEVFPESVGQYTGLKDKNGKEIYEGDSCMDDHLDKCGQVKFDEGKYIFEWDNICEDLFEVCDNIEVIGNIYENPEPLEE